MVIGSSRYATAVIFILFTAVSCGGTHVDRDSDMQEVTVVSAGGKQPPRPSKQEQSEAKVAPQQSPAAGAGQADTETDGKDEVPQIQIVNVGGGFNKGALLANELAKQGYDVENVIDIPERPYVTTVYYKDGFEKLAEEIGKRIAGKKSFQLLTWDSDYKVTVALHPGAGVKTSPRSKLSISETDDQTPAVPAAPKIGVRTSYYLNTKRYFSITSATRIDEGIVVIHVKKLTRNRGWYAELTVNYVRDYSNVSSVTKTLTDFIDQGEGSDTTLTLNYPKNKGVDTIEIVIRAVDESGLPIIN